MRRFTLLIAASVLVLLPCNLLAQHSGGHGGRGGSGGGQGGGQGSQIDPDMLSNLHHAMEVQAFGDQPARFQSLTKSTEDARKQAEAIQAATTSGDYSAQANALVRAVNQEQESNDSFVKSFSDSQNAGLKPLMKKLEKAQSDVAKECKSLDQQLKNGKSDGKRIADASGKLSRALTKLREEQKAIGDEKGMPQSS